MMETVSHTETDKVHPIIQLEIAKLKDRIQELEDAIKDMMLTAGNIPIGDFPVWLIRHYNEMRILLKED